MRVKRRAPTLCRSHRYQLITEKTQVFQSRRAQSHIQNQGYNVLAAPEGCGTLSQRLACKVPEQGFSLDSISSEDENQWCRLLSECVKHSQFKVNINGMKLDSILLPESLPLPPKADLPVISKRCKKSTLASEVRDTGTEVLFSSVPFHPVSLT